MHEVVCVRTIPMQLDHSPLWGVLHELSAMPWIFGLSQNTTYASMRNFMRFPFDTSQPSNGRLHWNAILPASVPLCYQKSISTIDLANSCKEELLSNIARATNKWRILCVSLCACLCKLECAQCVCVCVRNCSENLFTSSVFNVQFTLCFEDGWVSKGIGKEKKNSIY